MPELVWEGKYDPSGRRVAPLRVSLPFQTIETVNESAQERQRALDFFAADKTSDWRNRLIWGDNKYVLSALREDFAGQVDLVYIDPPFATGQDFSVQANVGDSEFVKEPSVIEQKAYRDTWGRGLDSYFQFMYDRLGLLRDLMTQTGSIFVHLDAHMSPYVKVILDEVFGQENFQNQIAWYYYNKFHGATKRTVPKAFDIILYYVKDRDSAYTFHTLSEPRETPIKQLKRQFVGGKIINAKDEFGKTITYLSTER
jgi:adenine specific DNA methylase Mod